MNTKLLLFALTISSGFFAQISITNLDIPVIGNQFVNIQDFNFGGISAGNPGENQIYDFSFLQNTSEDTINYLSPFQTVFGGSFPTSNLASYTSSDSSFTFFSSSANSLLVNGMTMQSPVGPEKLIVKSTTPLKQLDLPSTYLSNFTSQGLFSTNAIYFHQEITPDPLTYFDSIRGQITISRNSTIDGWGDLITPFGYSVPVLRQVVTDITAYLPEFYMFYVDTFFGNAVTIPIGYQAIPGTEVTDTSKTYYYITNGIDGRPLILAEIAENAIGTITSVQYAKLPMQAGLDLISKNQDLTVFPNPSSELVNFYCKNKMDRIEILSLDGKIIMEHKINTNEFQLNMKDLNPGTYISKIYSNNEISTRKIVKK